MEKLRLKFVDFWISMDNRENNYFYKLLSPYFDIEFSDTPDILFYSCFGSEHLKYTCTRIFFSTENWRPNFSESDYAITFDYVSDKRHLRFPLWAAYYLTYQEKKLLNWTKDTKNLHQEWTARNKFCCLIVSNEKAKERIDFFNQLNAVKEVDSAGGWNNTIGRKIDSGTFGKFEFIKDYRFVISFENSSYPGYTTEKIIEPILAGCIPIYWGDPRVNEDFNQNRFIGIKDRTEYASAIETILHLDNNKELAKSILSESLFVRSIDPVYIEKEYVIGTILNWVNEAKSKRYRGVGAKTSQRLKYFSVNWKSRLVRVKNKIIYK